jgi:hypothetical protein
MVMGLETLRDCGQDLRKSKGHHLDPTGPQVHWPEMQITGETAKFEALRMQSLLKRATNQKREIVDTSTHAFCSFGHSPSLGLAFPTIWEME